MRRRNYFYSFSALIVTITTIASALYYSADDINYQEVDNSITHSHENIQIEYYKKDELKNATVHHPLYKRTDACRDCVTNKRNNVSAGCN